MPEINLTPKETSVDTTRDTVVIVNCFETLPSGRALDVSGFPDSEIRAGHVIIKDNSNPPVYKPLPVNGTLPSSHTYEGFLTVSISKEKPAASIMTRGTINESYVQYSVPAAAKTALPSINFITT